MTLCVATFVGWLHYPLLAKSVELFWNLIHQESVPAESKISLEHCWCIWFGNQKSNATCKSFCNSALFSVNLVILFPEYVLMLFAFHLKSSRFRKALVCFTVSSVGVLVPTPGSAGSYHISPARLCKKSLALTRAVIGFATVTHLMCFCNHTCVPAAICFIIQSVASGKKILARLLTPKQALERFS